MSRSFIAGAASGLVLSALALAAGSLMLAPKPDAVGPEPAPEARAAAPAAEGAAPEVATAVAPAAETTAEAVPAEVTAATTATAETSEPAAAAQPAPAAVAEAPAVAPVTLAPEPAPVAAAEPVIAPPPVEPTPPAATEAPSPGPAPAAPSAVPAPVQQAEGPAAPVAAAADDVAPAPQAAPAPLPDLPATVPPVTPTPKAAEMAVEKAADAGGDTGGGATLKVAAAEEGTATLIIVDPSKATSEPQGPLTLRPGESSGKDLPRVVTLINPDAPTSSSAVPVETAPAPDALAQSPAQPPAQVPATAPDTGAGSSAASGPAPVTAPVPAADGSTPPAPDAGATAGSPYVDSGVAGVRILRLQTAPPPAAAPSADGTTPPADGSAPAKDGATDGAKDGKAAAKDGAKTPEGTDAGKADAKPGAEVGAGAGALPGTKSAILTPDTAPKTGATPAPDATADGAAAPAATGPDPFAPSPDDTRAVAHFAAPFQNPDRRPLVGILLFDPGVAGGGLASDAIAALPIPVTVAVDPSRADASDAEKAYRAAGKEVAILASNLPAGATAQDVAVSYQSYRAALPESVALIGEPGSVLGQGGLALQQMADMLAGDGRGLISYGGGLNGAQMAAKKRGVPVVTLSRYFDATDALAPGYLAHELDRAAFLATQKGSVVVAMPATPDTIAALTAWAGTVGTGAPSSSGTGAVAVAPVSALLRTTD